MVPTKCRSVSRFVVTTVLATPVLAMSVFAMLSLASPLYAQSARTWTWNAEAVGTRSLKAGHSIRFESLSFGEIPVIGARRKFYRGVPIGKPIATDFLKVDENAWQVVDSERILNGLRMRRDERGRQIRWSIQPALLYSSRKKSVTPVWEAVPSSDSIQFLYTEILETASGKLLWRKPKFRKLSSHVYPTSPYNDGSNDLPATSVTLPTLGGGASTLVSSFLNVKRQQPDTGSGFELVAVDPTTNFYSGGTTDFDEDPSAYASTCRGTSAECANQGLDAVNVFYHVENYRIYLDSLLTDIGEAPSFADPVLVLVNAIGFDTNGDDNTDDEVNNAFFTQCSIGSFTGCLLFNPPAAANYSSCGVGTKVYYDLAREAKVAVHEYQHYITDLITGMVTGENGANVGDILHEGYSDYFGVSEVNRISGTEDSTILNYGFQNCPSIQRTIGTLKVYDSSSTRTDPHYYGWTWASGLFELNKQLGSTVVDKIALKSLFYLPTDPSFTDAIEALVQADQDLNDGVNAGTIRTLFYSTLKFVGGSDLPFADISRGVVSVGVTSCISTPLMAPLTTQFPTIYSGWATGAAGVLWLLGLILGGRRIPFLFSASKKERA